MPSSESPDSADELLVVEVLADDSDAREGNRVRGGDWLGAVV